ncbi:MAG: hypothetical protein RIR55_1421 [Bacteroidota bacterium]|jgi:hypothetical protein
MKSSWFFSAVALFILASCINGEQTYKVDYTDYLTAGASKVWELDNSKPSQSAQQENFHWGQFLFVFYSSGKLAVGSLSDFSNKKFDIGSFQYEAETQTLKLQVKKESWQFQLQQDGKGGLWLKKIKGSNMSKILHLVSFREPF